MRAPIFSFVLVLMMAVPLTAQRALSNLPAGEFYSSDEAGFGIDLFNDPQVAVDPKTGTMLSWALKEGVVLVMWKADGIEKFKSLGDTRKDSEITASLVEGYKKGLVATGIKAGADRSADLGPLKTTYFPVEINSRNGSTWVYLDDQRMICVLAIPNPEVPGALETLTKAVATIRLLPAAAYDRMKRYAVSSTNAAFPFIFTVVTENFELGKLVSTEIDVDERQAQGVDRQTKTLKEGKTTLRSYSVMVGFGKNTYCSKDGIKWTGPQEYVCPGPDDAVMMRISTPRTPETAEYSVSEKSLDGKPVKVYRKYAVYPASEAGGKKYFEEEIATIDSRGFFISVEDTEGTLNPRDITLKRKQTWDFTTKFKPVVAPK